MFTKRLKIAANKASSSPIFIKKKKKNYIAKQKVFSIEPFSLQPIERANKQRFLFAPPSTPPQKKTNSQKRKFACALTKPSEWHSPQPERKQMLHSSLWQRIFEVIWRLTESFEMNKCKATIYHQQGYSRRFISIIGKTSSIPLGFLRVFEIHYIF